MKAKTMHSLPPGKAVQGNKTKLPDKESFFRFQIVFPQISQIITEADIRHSVFSIFSYFCPADGADKRRRVLASIRRALPYAECHKAVGLGR